MADRTQRDPQDQAFGKAAAEDQAAADAMADQSGSRSVDAASDEPMRDPAPRAAGKADPD